DDMPFLVDSVMGELTDRGLAIRLVAHPILAVERCGAAGTLASAPADARERKDAPRESYIHIHVGRIESAEQRAELTEALRQVLDEVRISVTDWRPMVARVGTVIEEIKTRPPPLPADDVAEA